MGDREKGNWCGVIGYGETITYHTLSHCADCLHKILGDCVCQW